ncbi:MAG: phosphotransacetylase family protein [Anaerolineales bacterium]|jgi:BioD-like phosphotransacetylase family protein
MNALYITSVEPYSGKTAVALALGRQLQSDGHKVGYLKPVSTQPWRTPQGKLADEDAVFIHYMLGLEGDPAQAATVIITPTTLRERLKDLDRPFKMDQIVNAAKQASADKDVLLLEGGASLRDGYAMGLSNLHVSEVLGAPSLVIVSYRGEMRLIDDALAARFRLGERMIGMILNHIPEDAVEFVEEYALPFMEREGLPILGTLPHKPRLSALSIGELVDFLQAEVLTAEFDPEALVETFTVGAMTADAALSRFRKYQNKAVITGGDRTDIQLAALETSTATMILTGNLRPSPLIIKQAEALKVPILLVKTNTMETVDVIERTHGKTRLGQQEKLDTFLQLMKENINLKAIYEALGLG